MRWIGLTGIIVIKQQFGRFSTRMGTLLQGRLPWLQLVLLRNPPVNMHNGKILLLLLTECFIWQILITLVTSFYIVFVYFFIVCEIFFWVISSISMMGSLNIFDVYNKICCLSNLLLIQYTVAIIWWYFNLPRVPVVCTRFSTYTSACTGWSMYWWLPV